MLRGYCSVWGWISLGRGWDRCLLQEADMRKEVKCPKSRIGVTTRQSPTQGEIIIGVKGRYAHVASGIVELSIAVHYVQISTQFTELLMSTV